MDMRLTTGRICFLNLRLQQASAASMTSIAANGADDHKNYCHTESVTDHDDRHMNQDADKLHLYHK